MITIYGIPNCDTIKKTRKWLKENDIDYQFHDYKKQGVPEKNLKTWVKQLGWEALLNKRGTTWRKLDDDVKESIDQKSAIQIMLDNPSIIKRPVLDIDDTYCAGFNEENYRALFF
jgi:arsenate reductase (glutaredoxin)